MERDIRLVGNGQALVHMYWENLLKMVKSEEINSLEMASNPMDMDEVANIYYRFEKEDRVQRRLYRRSSRNLRHKEVRV
ncbi:hypothetical protein BGZ60DRAFT_401571 [Tricladium varicosporioides]|nr:hypothetical protein BGZ60DRAFT_401571 [Hymenoscyphus varicosporioides]